MSFLTFKLFLINIPATFDGVKMPWNKKYDKVRPAKLFLFYLNYLILFNLSEFINFIKNKNAMEQEV